MILNCILDCALEFCKSLKTRIAHTEYYVDSRVLISGQGKVESVDRSCTASIIWPKAQPSNNQRTDRIIIFLSLLSMPQAIAMP